MSQNKNQSVAPATPVTEEIVRVSQYRTVEIAGTLVKQDEREQIYLAADFARMNQQDENGRSPADYLGLQFDIVKDSK